jgi:tRNA(fMet)-specific endonuclease VapC
VTSFLLDTNILVYAFKDQGGCRERINRATPQSLAISSITIFEIEFGLTKSNNPSHLREFLQKLRQRSQLLGLDEPSAAHAGRLRAHLAALGQPIGPYDLLISGIALSHNLTLVTRNTREFERVPGLKIENWHEE